MERGVRMGAYQIESVTLVSKIYSFSFCLIKKCHDAGIIFCGVQSPISSMPGIGDDPQTGIGILR